MTLEIGKQFGHYKIHSPIGAGGMGEVFLAQDVELERRVALKVLPDDFAENEDRVRRFVQEARAASALNHPNILTIYEIGEREGTHFIATEFIEGETLRQRLKSSSLSLRETLDIALQIVAALNAAHAAKIVHRDIKPENIMLREDGLVKILDFGIAKLTEKKQIAVDAEAATAINVATSPGMIIGTANYMSPEQARGLVVDARSDIFSFGIVLYEMISGKKAFDGETAMDAHVAILHKEPAPISRLVADVPQEIERIINKTLKKDCDERFQTAKDLLIDLKAARQNLEFQNKFGVPPSGDIKQTEAQTEILEVNRTDEKTSLRGGTPNTVSSAEDITGKVKKHRREFALASLVLLFAAIGLGYWFFSNRVADTRQIESIAVLPFVNESGNVDVEYLSDGMTETLISSLSQIPKLNVKARSSVFRYKGKETSAQTIGKELNVQAILNGRVVQRGQDLILYLELVDANTGNRIWGDQYNRKTADLVSLQSEIAFDVSQKLKTKLSGADKQNLAKNYTENAEAYKLYLQGRFYWNKRTPVENRKAVDYFEQAIALDPNYALAYAALADCYILQLPSMPRKERFPKARAAAIKALEIDETLGEAHTALAEVEVDAWNWSVAERGFKRAIELSPNYPTARHWHAELLSRLGRHDEAIREMKRAQELDPLSLIINAMVGHTLMMARRYDEAIEQFKKTLEMDPNFNLARIWLARAYTYKGMYEEAITEREKRIDGPGGNPDNRATQIQNFAELKAAYRKSGAKGFWEKRLEIQKQNQAQGGSDRPFVMAEIYANLGDKDQALEWLEKVIEERGGDGYIKVDPALDQLRDDPRFQELLRRVGFPQ